MKQKSLVLAVLGGALCVVAALWPARTSMYYTASYVGMSACALLALFCVERPLRWVALVALVCGLTGVYMSRHSHPPARTPVANPNQSQPAGGPAWIQWSSTNGGNNHWYALTPTATDWDTAEKLAVSYGGTLATITSAQEQNFINDMFLTGEFEFKPVWIGLIRTHTNAPPMGGRMGAPVRAPVGVAIGPPRVAPTLGARLRLALADLGFNVNVNANVRQNNEFNWVTGEDFSYSNWKPGEPNNSPPGESWVAINWEYAANRPSAVKGNWNDTPLNGTTGYGGQTTGPYFGLVELGQPSEPWLTPSHWGLITLAVLALTAGVAVVSIRLKSKS